jgi:hypothetical protein
MGRAFQVANTITINRKQSAHLADGEIRHLESVLNAARHLDALAQSRCLDASYWATRAYELGDKYTLLASQQNRVTALVRAFEAHALAARSEGLAQTTSPALIAA